MSIGSGLAASLGVAAESTYGTFVTPTKWFEFNKEDIKKVKNTVQGGGLAAGRFAQLGSRRVVTTQAASGSVDFEVPNKGFGIFLQHLMGGSAAPVQQAATAAYLQTHVLADNVGKYLTMQEGVPDLAGTVRPYTYLGGKVLSGEFSCSVDQLLEATFDFDFQQVSEAQSLTAPSYVTGLIPFHFGQMAVRMGTFSSETSVTGVTGVKVKVERGQKTDRFYAGNATTFVGTKVEPIMNDWVKVTGTVSADFVDKTIFADRFSSDVPTSVVLEWVGPIIASTYAYTFRVRMPQVFFDGDSPTVDGPDVVSGDFPFTAQYDGTNSLVTVEYMTTDTTL